MTNKRIKFPVREFPIQGTILTHEVRAAAMQAALESLAAEGALIRGKYTGCPPIKASKKR
jgi:hypothetical protein